MPTVPALLLAFAVTAATLALARRSALSRLLSDIPNERSLHRAPVPRIGGMGLLAGLAAYLMAVPADPAVQRLAGGYLALALVSALDDRAGLPAWLRLGAHLAVASAWLALQGLAGAWLALLALTLAWSINLYNFMDGSDGLAGGMSFIGFLVYASAAALGGNLPLAGWCAALVCASAAFLCFNWHPARVFLGDAGSVPLGFCAGAIGIYGWHNGLWPALFGVIAFFPFFFDAGFTLVRRMLEGQRFWQAHRQHLYQRAILGGLGHRRLALRAYGLMLICAALALICIAFPAAGPLIIAVQLAAGFWIASRLRSIPTQQVESP